MQTRLVVLALWAAAMLCGAPCAQAADAPFEIVKSQIEIEVRSDGSYVESRQDVYRILNQQGAEALRQTTLSYTQGYQSYSVAAAYTLKKDGTRIDVPQQSILRGFGATSGPAFYGIQTMTVVFPNVEVGDEIGLTTLFTQVRPWFGESFSEVLAFRSEIPAHDVRIALTAPSDMDFKIDAPGLAAGTSEEGGGKTRRLWTYRNDAPTEEEADAVDEFDRSARLVVSTFKDYGDFANTYRKMLEDRTEVTPEIQALADSLTKDVRGNRETARALYEWVSLHIGYVNIVLGAGGYVPHTAAQVLANRFGDCKDHVILLEALLDAKGIGSTPVLINAEKRYTVSPSPSPFGFNHLITFVPSLNLYLDSTAHYAPFGVLPFSDTSKPVVQIATGTFTRTPGADAAHDSIRSVETLTIGADGSASGETRVTATGAPAVDLRAYIDKVKSEGEAEHFRQLMGPGVDGKLLPGNVGDLAPDFAFGARYRQAAALNIPGPGSIPNHLVYKPFSFTALIAGGLPPQRTQPYLCVSMAAEEDLTIHLPDGVRILALPRSQTLETDEIFLDIKYSHPDPATVHSVIAVRINHPGGSCTSAYYAKVHGALTAMSSALRSEILYQ